MISHAKYSKSPDESAEKSHALPVLGTVFLGEPRELPFNEATVNLRTTNFRASAQVSSRQEFGFAML